MNRKLVTSYEARTHCRSAASRVGDAPDTQTGMTPVRHGVRCRRRRRTRLDVGDAWLDAAQQVDTRVQTWPNQLFYYLFKKGLPKMKTVSARLLLAASEPPLLLAASVSPFAGRPFFLFWVFSSTPCCCLRFSRLCFPFCCLLLLILLLLVSLSPMLFPRWCLPGFMVYDFIEMFLCFHCSTFVPFK